jgi:hypothetical protein
MMSFGMEELTVATGRSKTCIGFHKIYLNLFAAIHRNFDRDLYGDLLIVLKLILCCLYYQ